MKLPVAMPNVGLQERELVNDVLRSNTMTHGKYQEQFEQMFAERQGVQQACACSSGTAALHLAMMALGVAPGDEVIVPDLTYVATANAVRYCQGKAVLADVLVDEWTLDPEAVKRAVTKSTVGIIAVHLYGVPARMRALRTVANDYGLWIVEDAAQALGATLYGREIGCFGDLATFSFTGNKVLTTGEGGMVITDDSMLATRVRHLRGQAQCLEIDRYWHDALGCNYRLSNLACAIGCAQLEHVGAMTMTRQHLDAQYRAALSEFVTFQHWPIDAKPSAWMVTVRFPSLVLRDEAEQRLSANGIETRRPFVPMGQLPMYGLGPGQPMALQLAETTLTLPTHQGVTQSDVKRIAEIVRDVVRREMPYSVKVESA